MSKRSPSHFRVAFLGFSEFERHSLTSYFRLAIHREPCYEPVHNVTDADFLVADADHGPSVQLVEVTERMDETVFIGAQSPPGATTWMMRPIDALHVMRELDTMAALAYPPPPVEDSGSAGQGTTIIEMARRPRGTERIEPTWEPAADPPTEPTTEPPTVPVPVLRPAPVPAPTPPLGAAATLPAAAAPPSVRRALAPATPLLTRAPPPVGPPPPPRALLVDDSEIALRFLESRLKPWGVQTDRATHSTKALDLLGRRDYDFVFLDLELGPDSELDGLALCQQIKHATSSLQATVVMVSAHHSELDRARGNLAGCDAYLGKPLVEADLTRLLRRHGLKPPVANEPRPA